MHQVVSTREKAEALVASRPWWYHRFEIFPGIVTPGVYDPSELLAALDLPSDMRGSRVLEIGPADGYFTKQLTLRGADVTAADYTPKDFLGFAIMEALHGAPLKFIQCNVYSIPEQGLEPFDLVICLGVLYHLPDMVRGLHVLRAVCRKQFILETLVSTEMGSEPFARYHRASTLNNDATNFWSPNVSCVESMLEDTGFVVERTRVLSESGTSARAAFWCTVAPSDGKIIKSDVAYLGVK